MRRFLSLLLLQFELPDSEGKAGGACTGALLKVLYRHHLNENGSNDGSSNTSRNRVTWVGCLRELRVELEQLGYDQIPVLSSSRLIDVNKPMYIVPPGCKGKRRAVLIGINYKNQIGELVSVWLLLIYHSNDLQCSQALVRQCV